MEGQGLREAEMKTAEPEAVSDEPGLTSNATAMRMGSTMNGISLFDGALETWLAQKRAQ